MSDPLHLRTVHGVTLAVPPSLASITTYVLLEQERWFEKEADFLPHLLKPGMTVVDIGANLGVYSLPMARLVGPQGRVFAYEPGSATRELLTASRGLNTAQNLEIVGAALSDSAREGRLQFGHSSELHALGEGGQGERVRITSLDAENAAHGWAAVDFLKIDAEGEEERILAGGREFFAHHSPLVMFEVAAGDKNSDTLRSAFVALGFRIFRLLNGAPILVPVAPNEPTLPFELNLFAARPDRAERLARDGLLALDVPAGPDHPDPLAAYQAWRAAGQPVPLRCAALQFAVARLRALCEREPTAERLSSLARVAWEAGLRDECVRTAKRLLDLLQRGMPPPREPFLPASARFDDIAPGPDIGPWFAAAAAEQFERAQNFSSFFSGMSMILPWLRSQPLASTEVERRHTLVIARRKPPVAIPPRLLRDAPDHLNANVWRSGRVPGTHRA